MPTDLYSGATLKKMAKLRGKDGRIGNTPASTWLRVIMAKYGYKSVRAIPDTSQFYSRGVPKGKKPAWMGRARTWPDIVRYSRTRDGKITSGVMKKLGSTSFTVMGQQIIDAAKRGDKIMGRSGKNAHAQIQNDYGSVVPGAAYALMYNNRRRANVFVKLRKKESEVIAYARKGTRGNKPGSHKGDTRTVKRAGKGGKRQVL